MKDTSCAYAESNLFVSITSNVSAIKARCMVPKNS